MLTSSGRSSRGAVVAATSRPLDGRRWASVVGLSRAFAARVEVQRAAVDAVALAAAVAGAVVEYVAEVAAAGGARRPRCGPCRARCPCGLDRLAEHGVGEARPAGAGVELGVRAEELVAAAGAAVDAVGLLVDVLARERALGGLRGGGPRTASGSSSCAPLLRLSFDLFHASVSGRAITRYASVPGDEAPSRPGTLP